VGGSVRFRHAAILRLHIPSSPPAVCPTLDGVWMVGGASASRSQRPCLPLTRAVPARAADRWSDGLKEVFLIAGVNWRHSRKPA
jgi:hypothetical protein